MSDLTLGVRPAVMPTSDAIHRAVWRWHFYAGLLVLPFMVLLAVTGGLYLYHDALDGWFHRDLLSVPARSAAALGPEELVARANADHPGSVYSYAPPASTTSSAAVGIEAPDGHKFAVYLDPHDGRILGTMDEKSSVMWTVRRLHSLALFGVWPTYIIEAVGGAAIILVITGIYLWWPRRRQNGGVVGIRGSAKQRVFWRDLHAVTGLIAGFFIFFLALTGMPWSAYWGDRSLAILTSAGQGFPAGAWGDTPSSTVPLKTVVDEVGWTAQNAPVPTSPSAGEHHHGGTMPGMAMPAPDALPPPIGLDQAVATFDRMGLAPGYAVALPSTPDGVYTGSVYPHDLDFERVIHLDQYTGRPIIDVGFHDYGLGGKAIEWGINVHMGQEFGLANQLVLTVVCLAIIAMVVSAVVMWWKRRPAGGLGVPPWPADRRVAVGVTVLVLALGALFPLTGLAILVMLGVDLLVTRVARRQAW